jgi:hypothetical protein
MNLIFNNSLNVFVLQVKRKLKNCLKMSFAKQSFFTIVFVTFLTNLSFSQQIDTMYVYPSTPTQGDSVFLFVHSTFTSTSCDLTSHFVSLTGNNIIVRGDYCVGNSFAFCNQVSRIFLGFLQPGTYSLSFTLRRSLIPCNSYSTRDNQQISFDVLPDCINSVPPTSIISDTTAICLGDSLKLKTNGGTLGTGSTWLWFSDSCSGNHIGTGDSIFVTPVANTTYFVRADDCGLFACKTVTVNVNHPPGQTLHIFGSDTVLCAGDTLFLLAPYGYDYLWQDGSFDSVFTVTQQGTYFVEISNQCGSASDTVQINYQTPPVISLGNDTVLCAGDTLLLSAPYGYDYLWQDSSLDSVFTVTQQGTYFVEISNLCGSASDTVQINYQTPPIISLGNDTVLCAGDTLLLSAPYGYDYLWQDSSLDSLFTVTQQGTYFVEINNQCGSASDTVQINYQTPPVISLGNDTVLCAGDTFQLYVPSNDYSLLWQDGSTDTVFSLTSSGTYWLSASNICGTNSDTIKLDFSYPFVDIGQDTVVCNNTNISFDAGVWSSYEWSTGATVPTISLSDQDTLLAIWLTVEDEYGCIATDSISVFFDPCLGSQSQEIFSDISIFPNPAKNEINIHIKNYDNSPFYCKVITAFAFKNFIN